LVKAQAESGSSRIDSLRSDSAEFALFGEAIAAIAIGCGKLFADLGLAIDHGATRRHLVVRRSGRADAGFPVLIALGEGGVQLRKCQAYAQQRSGEKGQNAHLCHPGRQFPPWSPVCVAGFMHLNK
jgi:hypothetical protein